MLKIGKLVRDLCLAGLVFGLASSPKLCAQTNAGDRDKATGQPLAKNDQPEKAMEPAKPSSAEEFTSASITQVEVCLALVSFNRNDLEAVARKSPGASVRAVDVLALWRAGKGRLLMTSTTRSTNGEQFFIGEVTEWRYPQIDGALSPPKSDKSFPSRYMYMANFSLDYLLTCVYGIRFSGTVRWDKGGKLLQMILEPDFPTKLKSENSTFKLVSPAGTNLYSFARPTFRSKAMAVTTICSDGETLVYNSDVLNRGDKEMAYLLITPYLIPNPAGKR